MDQTLSVSMMVHSCDQIFCQLKSLVGKNKNSGFTSSTAESTNCQHAVCIKSIQGEFYDIDSPLASSLSPPFPGSVAPTALPTTKVRSSLSPEKGKAPAISPSASLNLIGTLAPLKTQSTSPAGPNLPASPSALLRTTIGTAGPVHHMINPAGTNAPVKSPLASMSPVNTGAFYLHLLMTPCIHVHNTSQHILAHPPNFF